jgi:hypothetical protein
MARAIPYVSQEKKGELINKIISSQNPDGGWGINEGYESDIIDTCLVLEALMAGDGYDKEVQAAAQYLISTQNEDGSWGMYQGGEGSVYATSLAREKIYKYKETFRVDLSGTLDKSSQWLLGKKNAEGMWGETEDKIYLTAFAFKALNTDKWQDVQDIPGKIVSLQMADGSWEADPYLTALALEALLTAQEGTKVELQDVKLYVNGIETSDVKANDVIEIVPQYTGRDAKAEVSITDPAGEKTDIPIDNAGRYLWPAGMNKEGNYSAEVVLKNGESEVVGSQKKEFVIQPYLQINNAYIEVTPGSSKLNKPVSPVVRMYVEGEGKLHHNSHPP